jgi:serine/threonine protein phosphatase PrpC
MLFGHNQLDGRGRPTEDRIAFKKLFENFDLFAVFDGHSGSTVVRYTVDALPRRIQAAIEASPGGIQAILRDPTGLIPLLKTCFIEHDKDLARQTIKFKSDSGSTATVALVTPTHIIMAFCGDSPAFVINPFNGMILHEIGKHEPTLLSETERIKAAGGFIEIDEYGTPRVDGALMVSRAFGDFTLKWPEKADPPFESDWSKMKVTADPDIVIWQRPQVGVLAIMSDGLVETPTNALKPTAQVGRDIYVALKASHYDLTKAATITNNRHKLANTVGQEPYDGDDLSLVLVDVGLKEANAVQAAGGAAIAAAVAATQSATTQAIRVKSRKSRGGRRNKTGKKTRLAKIFCLQG